MNTSDFFTEDEAEEVERFIRELIEDTEALLDSDEVHPMSVKRNRDLEPLPRKDAPGFRVNSTITVVKLKAPGETWRIERESHRL